MALAIGTATLVLMALIAVVVAPRLARAASALRSFARAGARPRLALVQDIDPGRERRAEQRARALLRSCINDEEWHAYRELGLVQVPSALDPTACAYLVYPHKPILAYEPVSGRVLGEYCVDFPDRTRPYGSSRLPDADDVLAKWMTLVSDERSLIDHANMHLPGRQIRVAKARRDIARLAALRNEFQRSSANPSTLRAGSVSAP